MNKQFELEERIMKCWGILDQLDTVTLGAIEYDWTPDQISNALIGLHAVYSLEFQQLFDVFSETISERRTPNELR